jgi:uncharacterized protein YbjT (DUF2867 family)
MNGAGSARPVLLVVGGCGGLVGRAVLEEFSADHQIRSVHRHEVPAETAHGVQWYRADAASVEDWTPIVRGASIVLNLAWYRQAPAHRFEALAAGLTRLVQAADAEGVNRFVHVSVPDAPERLERELPYLALKRTVDRAVMASRLDYAIVRPTMLFGEGDVLLSVMLRTMARYRRFPMFGNGTYHVSPVSVRDLARVLRREADRGERRVVTVGGPERWVYRELTDRLFGALGLPPRYFRLGPRNSVRLAALLEGLGSSLLYAYEVEWLLSDMLGVAPYVGLDTPLEPVMPFVTRIAGRYRRGPGAPLAAP